MKGFRGACVLLHRRSQDLLDLRDQLARLQQKIHTRKLSALIPWVDALKQQVDDRIGDAGKGEE